MRQIRRGVDQTAKEEATDATQEMHDDDDEEKRTFLPSWKMGPPG